MSFAAVLLTPFVLLFPAAGVIETRELYPPPRAATVPADVPPGQTGAPPGPQPIDLGRIFRDVAESFRVDPRNQVRIEQHMEIRITPARPMSLPPNFLLNMPPRELRPHFIERNIGRCLPVSGISGVQPDQGNRLILFMRDRRMVTAMLERACRARDFYSGFYIARTPDGQLCVDRDTLLSRSGANCKLSRIRQLVESDD